jgi:hypothetical protein
MLRGFLRTLFAWQRRRGRQMGIRDGQPGAVTFIQRFGGALNGNPHLHPVVPDGLFVAQGGSENDDDDSLVFRALPPPTADDIRQLTAKIAARLTKVAQRFMPEDSDWYALSAGEQARRQLVGQALRAPGPRQTFVPGTEPPEDPLRASVDLVRYFGVFANRSRFRFRLPPPPPAHGAVSISAESPEPQPPAQPAVAAQFPNATDGQDSQKASAQHTKQGRTRTPWAQLLRRVFDVNALTCARCQAPLVLLALISAPKAIVRILEHLGLPSLPPTIAPAPRHPDPVSEDLELDIDSLIPDQQFDEDQDEVDQGPDRKRGPP